MKAFLTVLLVGLFCLPAARAQVVASTPDATYAPFRPQRTAGLKLGVNIANVTNLAESDIFIGYHGGFFGYVQISELLGAGGELNYSHQGVTASNIDLALNYLSIPVMANFYFDPVTFQAGGYGAFLFSAQGRNGTQTADISNYFQDNDYGLLFGLLFDTPGRTFFCGRVNWGLMNINNGLTKPKNVELFNRNIQVSFGYKFGG